MKLKIFWTKYRNILPVFGVLILCLVALMVTGLSLLKKVKSQPPKSTNQENNNNPSGDVYQINDDSLGLYFSMDKSMERISQQELTQKNPYFVYGFKPKDVESVACYVSQTKRAKPGYVSPEYLKDGTFNEIKKASPDIKLDSWDKVKLGEIEGARLNMTYKEGDKTLKQIEIVGTTDVSATFAFCAAPESLYNDLYKNKFDTFLNSLKIK